MPTVPTLDGPSIRASPIPDGQARVRVSPDTFGAPIAAGLADVGNVAHRVELGRERIRQEELDKQRQVQLGTFDLEANAVEERLLYDPKAGAMQAQGSRAFGVTTRTLEDYDKQVGVIAARIPDQKVREAFSEQTARRRQAMSQRLNIHEGNQYQRHDQDQFTANQANLQSQALRDAGDRKAVDFAVGRMEMGILEYGHRNGLPKETLEQMRGQARSSTHFGAIVALSDSGNYTAANQRFTEVSSALLPQDKAKLEKVLEIGTLRGDSQRLADEILATNPEATIAELLTVAGERAQADPRLREETEQRVAKLHAAREQAQHESQGNAFDAAYRVMQTDPRGFDALPPSSLLKMSPQHEETLRSFDRKGGVITTNRDVYYHLTQLSSTPAGRAVMAGQGKDPETGELFDLRAYRDRLSDADWQEMSKLVAGVRDKATAPETSKALAQIEDFESVARQSLAPLGIDSTVGVKNKDNAMVIAFKDALRRRVSGQQAITGKVMTREQVQKEADDLLVKEAAVKDAGLFAKFMTLGQMQSYTDPAGRYRFESPAVSGQAYSFDQVPQAEADEIKASMARKGIPFSEAAVVTLYNTQLSASASGQR